MEELIIWIWLNEKCVDKPSAFRKAYDRFGGAREIFEATKEELEELFGKGSKTAESLSDKDREPALAVMKNCKRKNIGILTYEDELYPSRLRAINDPPALLYYKGELPEIDNEVCIAAIGTRNPTDYGRRCAYEICWDLTICGALVISGMAAGIDGVCHTAALDAGGKTIAVLGCGVDVVYPAENREIYDRILKNGAVMSEYAPGKRATRYSFPRRNRIVSGMSLGSFVIEAQLKSGAMITADITKKQNRDLFALPGKVGEYNSLGPNALIQEGAKAVTTALDIIKEYEFLYPGKLDPQKCYVGQRYGIFGDVPVKKRSKNDPPFEVVKNPETVLFSDKYDEDDYDTSPVYLEGLSDENAAICACLSKDRPTSSEEIAAKTGIPLSDLMSLLTILEVQGIIKAAPGDSFFL